MYPAVRERACEPRACGLGVASGSPASSHTRPGWGPAAPSPGRPSPHTIPWPLLKPPPPHMSTAMPPRGATRHLRSSQSLWNPGLHAARATRLRAPSLSRREYSHQPTLMWVHMRHGRRWRCRTARIGPRIAAGRSRPGARAFQASVGILSPKILLYSSNFFLSLLTHRLVPLCVDAHCFILWGLPGDVLAAPEAALWGWIGVILGYSPAWVLAPTAPQHHHYSTAAPPHDPSQSVPATAPSRQSSNRRLRSRVGGRLGRGGDGEAQRRPGAPEGTPGRLTARVHQLRAAAMAVWRG